MAIGIPVGHQQQCACRDAILSPQGQHAQDHAHHVAGEQGDQIDPCHGRIEPQGHAQCAEQVQRDQEAQESVGPLIAGSARELFLDLPSQRGWQQKRPDAYGMASPCGQFWRRPEASIATHIEYVNSADGSQHGQREKCAGAENGGCRPDTDKQGRHSAKVQPHASFGLCKCCCECLGGENVRLKLCSAGGLDPNQCRLTRGQVKEMLPEACLRADWHKVAVDLCGPFPVNIPLVQGHKVEVGGFCKQPKTFLLVARRECWHLEPKPHGVAQIPCAQRHVQAGCHGTRSGVSHGFRSELAALVIQSLHRNVPAQL